MGVRPEDFLYISKLVKKEIGIILDTGKEYLVETRLNSLVSSDGFSSLDDLIGTLRRSSDADLKRKVLDAMTTNETLFFRDGKPFEALRLDIIPALIKSRPENTTINIWCAAASSGQEPYSLAIMIKENFGNRKVSFKIRATDICSEILGKANKGVYTQFEVNRGLPATLLMKYFKRRGMKWQISQDIRSMVDFSELNLMETWHVVPQCDIILMRNVLIYFDEETKKSILAKVRTKLVPDGYFFLGGAETIGSFDPNYVRELYQQAQVYRIKSN